MATRELRFYRADENEYRAIPVVIATSPRESHGSVFAMRRIKRGWEIGTRINGDWHPFYSPGVRMPLLYETASTDDRGGQLYAATLREAKDAVRRMARFGASGGAAATYVGMMERGEGVNARLLMSAWLAGRSDVLGQFTHAAKKERVLADGTVTDSLGNFLGIDQPTAASDAHVERVAALRDADAPELEQVRNGASRGLTVRQRERVGFLLGSLSDNMLGVIASHGEEVADVARETLGDRVR